MLTDARIRKASPKAKAFKLYHGRGLFLLVQPNGSKLWRLRYQWSGRERLLSLGEYPRVSLVEAEAEAEGLREQVARGIDPSTERRTAKAIEEGLDTFERVAREWLNREAPKWTEKHLRLVTRRLEMSLFPSIGRLRLDEIDAPRLLEALRDIERHSPLIAQRMRQAAEHVFRFGIASGRASRNPAVDLRGLTAPVVEKHRPAIVDPVRIGELLRAIEGYPSPTTRAALQLLALTFVRPGELRAARWDEFDFDDSDGPVWRIPSGRMKSRRYHLVPLATQAVAILRELEGLTGGGRSEYLFPSSRSFKRPMSDMTLNAALRRLGFEREEVCAHGFRTMASTRLNESQRWHRDAIERQLAHGERDKVRAAYNSAEHLIERRRMMQWWAEYLESLREGGKLIPFPKPAG